MNSTLLLKQMIQHPFYKKKVYYFNKTDLHFVILTVCYFENECLQGPRDFSVEPYPVPWHKSIQRRTHRRQTMSHLDPVKEDNNRWRLKDESDIWSLVLLTVKQVGPIYIYLFKYFIAFKVFTDCCNSQLFSNIDSTIL